MGGDQLCSADAHGRRLCGGRNAAARGGDFLRSELARRRATLSVHRTPAWKDGADALDSGEQGGSPDVRHQ